MELKRMLIKCEESWCFVSYSFASRLMLRLTANLLKMSYQQHSSHLSNPLLRWHRSTIERLTESSFFWFRHCWLFSSDFLTVFFLQSLTLNWFSSMSRLFVSFIASAKNHPADYLLYLLATFCKFLLRVPLLYTVLYTGINSLASHNRLHISSYRIGKPPFFHTIKLAS